MIKVTYETTGKDLKKPEKTTINIFDGRFMAQYSIPDKAKMIVKQMKDDGKKGVLYSRGAMIQIFKDKTEDEILVIVQKDIETGLLVADDKHGKKFTVKNLVIKKQ